MDRQMSAKALMLTPMLIAFTIASQEHVTILIFQLDLHTKLFYTLDWMPCHENTDQPHNVVWYSISSLPPCNVTNSNVWSLEVGGGKGVSENEEYEGGAYWWHLPQRTLKAQFALRMSTGRWHASYFDFTNTTKTTPFETRRSSASLCMLHKIFNDMCYFPKIVEPRNRSWELRNTLHPP